MTEEAAKKGRPTPSRKDAESKRKVSTLAPVIGKEAKKRDKALARERRVAAREAYLRGDENALPLRDRGPVRRFVRDEVDGRRSIGEFFMPIIFVVLLFSVVPNMTVNVIAIVLMYTVLLFAVVDGFFLSRKLKKQILKSSQMQIPRVLECMAGCVQLRCVVYAHLSRQLPTKRKSN